MTRREEILRQMLTLFNDAEDPTCSSSGIPGTGERVSMMGPAWNRSFRELERCLREMRSEAPWLWWDVRERFLACEYRTVECPLHRTRKGPVPRLPKHCEEVAVVEYLSKTARVRVRSWSPLVDEGRVAAGVRWVSDRFRGEPFIPPVMQEVA